MLLALDKEGISRPRLYDLIKRYIDALDVELATAHEAVARATDTIAELMARNDGGHNGSA